MMKMKQRRQPFTMTDPTTWATDPTRMIPDVTRPKRRGDESLLSVGGMTLNVSVAANESAQGATGGDVIVIAPAPSELTDNANASGPGPSVEFGTSKVNATQTATITTCEHCGDEFMPRRPHGRFCSSYCRRLAWLERNPAKAAELAERDRQRWREHVIGCGGEWREHTRVEQGEGVA